MNLTLISKKEYDTLSRTKMTAEEAYKYMNEEIALRKFSDMLLSYAQGLDTKKLLIDELCRYDSMANRDSVSRKVRDWFAGKYEPSDRETYFKICFALGLNETRANSFLMSSDESGIHYRDPKELVYAFALRKGITYPEAVTLYNSLPPLIPGEEQKADKFVYTSTLYDEFAGVETVEEFERFYRANMDKLGALHNTAFRYFTKFMDCLRTPDNYLSEFLNEDILKSDKLSIEMVVEEYLRMDMPSDKRKVKYTYVQKMIKKYWPSATSIKNMCSRREDVTRKTLILLYIITRGIVPELSYGTVRDGEDDEAVFMYDDVDLSPEDVFEEHFDKLSLMLNECGMAVPDPRNVFDWAALYSIRMSSDDEDEIGGAMKELINVIFD